MRSEPGERYEKQRHEHSALGKAAKEDDRTKAAMGRKFIVDGLRKAGWLKATSLKRQATRERQKEGAHA